VKCNIRAALTGLAVVLVLVVMVNMKNYEESLLVLKKSEEGRPEVAPSPVVDIAEQQKSLVVDVSQQRPSTSKHQNHQGSLREHHPHKVGPTTTIRPSIL